MRRLIPLFLALIPTALHIGQNPTNDIQAMIKVDTAQEKCLATVIYSEARGESLQGQVAVAFTVLNRAVNRTLCQVVLSPKQYSAFNNNPALRAAALSKHLEPIQKNVIDKKSWEQSLTVARMVMANFVKDPSNGATHYIAPALMKIKHYHYPKWTKQYKLVAVINGHKFYKNDKT